MTSKLGMFNSSLPHLVRAMWGARVGQFWLIWITIGIVAAVAVILAVHEKRADSSGSGISTPQRQLIPISASGWAALVMLAIFLAAYSWMVLVWEDFAYHDNSMFTQYSLQGKNIAPPIWPAMGRFFPLGYQEFNLIRYFASSAVGYHAFPLLQIILLTVMLLMLQSELSMAVRTGFTVLVLLAPGFVISFGGLIYSDRNLIFFLVALVFSVKRFDETHRTRWGVAAVASAQVMIYCKETAFLLLLVFALARLALRSRAAKAAGTGSRLLPSQDSRLDVCLAAVAITFLLYYVAVMLPHPNAQYAVAHRQPLLTIVGAYLKLDWLAWSLLAVVLIRCVMAIRGSLFLSPLWDALGLGGAAYFLSYLYLRMYSAYYLGPVDLIAVIYLGRLLAISYSKQKFPLKLATSALICAIVLQNLSLTACRVYERKNVIHGKDELAAAIQSQFQSQPRGKLRLFFPFSTPYRVMEFASYLSYRGLPVERSSDAPLNVSSVALASPAVTKDGPCQDYESFECHAASSPTRGDLIVVLPEDDASESDASVYTDQGRVLNLYQPRPVLPDDLTPWLRSLHIVSFEFPGKEFPDRWLRASVSVWSASG